MSKCFIAIISKDITNDFEKVKAIDAVLNAEPGVRDWRRHFEQIPSSYLIATEMTTGELVDLILKHISKDASSLFVTEISKYRNGWLLEEHWEWLKKNMG